MSRSRVRPWIRRAVVSLLLGVALVGIPSSSVANPLTCEGSVAPEPEHAGSGLGALVLSPQQAEMLDESAFQGRGLYADYGMTGMQLHTITETCIDTADKNVLVIMGDFAWGLTRIIAEIAIFVYQLSASDAILEWATSAVAKFVLLLRDGLWRPLVPTMTIVGAITLAYWGLIKKRATLTAEGAIWMILATALGFWITGAPHQVMQVATFTSNLSTSILHDTVGETMFQADGCVTGSAQPIPFQDTDNPEHYGPSDGGFDSVEKSEVTTGEPLWVNTSMIHDSLVCQPWRMVVFGGSEQGKEAAELYSKQAHAAGAFSRTELERMRGASDDFPTEHQRQMESKEEEYRAVSEQIANYYPEAWGPWSGHDSGHRFASAATAMIGAILGGILIFIVSGALLVSKIGTLFWILLSPFALLVGIHPGMGRILLQRYGEWLLGLVLTQIFIQLVQVIFLSLYGVLFITTMPWAVKIALIFVIYVLAFVFRKKLAQAIASASSGVFGRAMGKVAEDKSLGRAANALPGVALYKADRAARAKLKPLVGQALGTALGGPMGGELGRQAGEKSAAKMQKNQQPRAPQEAPPMDTPRGPKTGRWTARDVTPQEPTTPRRPPSVRPGERGALGPGQGPTPPPPQGPPPQGPTPPPLGPPSPTGGGWRPPSEAPALPVSRRSTPTPPPPPPPPPSPQAPPQAPPTRRPAPPPPEGRRLLDGDTPMIVHDPPASSRPYTRGSAPRPMRPQMRLLPRDPKNAPKK